MRYGLDGCLLGSHSEVLELSVVVGEAEAVKHGGAKKDTLADLRMCHGPRAVHECHIADCSDGAMSRIRSTLSRRGPHKCLLQWVHGLEDL